MNILILKESIAKYFKNHGAEIICGLAALNENANTFESYLDNYLLLRK